MEIYKIKSGFTLREVAGNFIVVAVGSRVKEFNGVINLSETGAFIWKQLEQGATQDQIVKNIVDTYEITEDRAEKDTVEFLNKLKEAGLLK